MSEIVGKMLIPKKNTVKDIDKPLELIDVSLIGSAKKIGL